MMSCWRNSLSVSCSRAGEWVGSKKVWLNRVSSCRTSRLSTEYGSLLGERGRGNVCLVTG